MADFKPERGNSQGVSAGRFAGIGLQFAGAIVLFLFIGQWVDKKLGTSPVFLIIGVFGGASASFYSMYRKLMAANAAEDAERKKNK